MKLIPVGMLVVTIAGAAVTAALVYRPARPPAAVQSERPTAPERFAGAADTLSPAELGRVRARNKAEMAAWHQKQEDIQRAIERRVEIARARPRSIRLPAKYRWGRCLLVVAGETRISGRCAYSVEKNGDFSIQGPRQIYGGIDFPKAESMAEERSNDYWAEVFKNPLGWTGYGNGDIRAVHGDSFGPLRRRGHCWTGKAARICLWTKRPKSSYAHRRQLEGASGGGE